MVFEKNTKHNDLDSYLAYIVQFATDSYKKLYFNANQIIDERF